MTSNSSLTACWHLVGSSWKRWSPSIIRWTFRCIFNWNLTWKMAGESGVSVLEFEASLLWLPLIFFLFFFIGGSTLVPWILLCIGLCDDYPTAPFQTGRMPPKGKQSICSLAHPGALGLHDVRKLLPLCFLAENGSACVFVSFRAQSLLLLLLLILTTKKNLPSFCFACVSFFKFFVYLFLAALGFHLCLGAFSGCGVGASHCSGLAEHRL